MDQDTLSALASLPLEIEERKVRMAQQRLQASYVQGKDLDVKHGGAASLQDVLRLLQSLQGGQPVQPGMCVNNGVVCEVVCGAFLLWGVYG